MKKLIFIILIGFSVLSYASIKYVPSEYSTIQIAINCSSNGDTIILKKGRYSENINLNGKNIVVASMYLSTNDTDFIANTIIDGQGKESVIKIVNNENESTVICGLSIINGKSSKGGGIQIGMDSKPAIKNCKVYNNTANSGGGISVGDKSMPIIQSCKIFNNKTIGTCVNGTCGGGIVLGNYSRAKLFNCEIYNNRTECTGGGIYAISNPNVTLYRFSLSIDRCVFYGNDAAEGGGIASMRGCNIKVTNSVFSNNFAKKGPEILIYDGNATLINSIVYNDSISIKPSIHFEKPSCCSLYTSNEFNMHNSLIYGGAKSVNVIGNNANYFNSGSIESDPMFVDYKKNNYHLKDNSPCIDKGISQYIINSQAIESGYVLIGNVYTPVTSKDQGYIAVGDTLINMSTNDFNGNSPDIGAFEFFNSTPVNINEFHGIKIYPNPTIETISIISPDDELLKIEIYNLEGQIIKSNHINKFDYVVNLSTFKSGIYILKLFTTNGLFIRKLTKK